MPGLTFGVTVRSGASGRPPRRARSRPPGPLSSPEASIHRRSQAMTYRRSAGSSARVAAQLGPGRRALRSPHRANICSITEALLGAGNGAADERPAPVSTWVGWSDDEIAILHACAADVAETGIGRGAGVATVRAARECLPHRSVKSVERALVRHGDFGDGIIGEPVDISADELRRRWAALPWPRLAAGLAALLYGCPDDLSDAGDQP